MKERCALIIVDVQNDFCEGGALAVDGGRQVARRIDELLQKSVGDYALIVATRDWHPAETSHFDTWPSHCVAGTFGAEFAEPLASTFEKRGVPIVSKGAEPDSDSYSGFSNEELERLLRADDLDTIEVCGLAFDFCVGQTALDAKRLFPDARTSVLRDLTASVAAESEADMEQELTAAGVAIVASV
ncbi:MAG: isochorismatase family protein [Actinomycetia bacterium]|nr:isochorismatase family protein [Actinomycetes bacterium]